MNNNEAAPTAEEAAAATTETLAEIGRLFDGASRILICGHERPDGDCLGSQVALSLALEAVGKQTRHNDRLLLRRISTIAQRSKYKRIYKGNRTLQRMH